MPRPYRPIAFANAFIVRAQPDGAEHMKLQKLVYYAYGWWLQYHGEPIISEAPQIWRFGPVFESLYHAMKHFGRSPIPAPQNDLPFGAPPQIDEGDGETHQLVRFVWTRYGQMTSFELSDRTHEPGTAWRTLAEQRGWHVPHSTPIPSDLIRTEIEREVRRFGLK